MTPIKSTAEFVLADNARGLFPLASTLSFIRHGGRAIGKYLAARLQSADKSVVAFRTCPIEYALKDECHVRRTLVLDPVASYFLYDFVLSNRRQFAACEPGLRQSYGYAFAGASLVDSFLDYHAFRRRKYELRTQYKCFAQIDIANCFNSFYHHDVVAAIQAHIGEDAAHSFGRFLREINAGDSVSCFPQGVYPAKTIGNWFLRFIEQSGRLKSKAIIRFLDDIVFFDNSRDKVRRDLLVLQQILGTHALALNAEKTRAGSSAHDFEERDVDDIKRQLLRKREELSTYDEGNESDSDEDDLSEEERDYLRSLINDRTVGEEDVELALSLVRDEPVTQRKLMTIVIAQHPHLLKSVYSKLSDVDDPDGEIWTAVAARLKETTLSAYELFWLVRLMQDRYEWGATTADRLSAALEHPSATPVVRAAVLEHEQLTHGFEDLKIQTLRDEAGSFVSTAAAAGLRLMAKGKRNQVYKYAGKTGEQMGLLCTILGST